MNGFEKFPPHELKMLYDELKQSGLDLFQIGELLAGFLVQHGYGVSTAQARATASSIEVISCTLPRLQEELEKLALVM